MVTNRLFDPAEILGKAVGANATKFDPNPVGECLAQIVEIKLTSGNAGPKAKNPGAPWNRLDIKLETSDPDYLALYPNGDTREKATIFDGIMLDIDNGEIATGPNRNIALGRLREAAGVNGQPLSALSGQFVRVAVSQKPHPDAEKAAAGDIVNQVTGYTKA